MFCRSAGTIYEIILSPSFFTSLLFSFCQKQQFNSEAGLSRNSAPCFVSYHSITIKTLLLHSWILLPAAPFAIHSVGTIIFKRSTEVPLGFVRQEQCFTFHVEEKGCAKCGNTWDFEIFLAVSIKQDREVVVVGAALAQVSSPVAKHRWKERQEGFLVPFSSLSNPHQTGASFSEELRSLCAGMCCWYMESVMDIWNFRGYYSSSLLQAEAALKRRGVK